MGDTGLSEPCGRELRRSHSALFLSVVVSAICTPMVNVKISGLNGGVEVIGKLSVTPAVFFPINLIDPRLVTLSPELFAVVNAASIGGGGSVVAVAYL